ncbi:polyisoprenoid diphosphate/phosphate phosphohydrolase PLPP6 [Spea bombifrons]|uniref:polyisoprenoid diphosphate/phosphate phosphohydrolase PLPP6 n=1 Tax=Spea bombifrons TaxID=233779 RepID=UPI00234C0236|nr:polyisoprenoid diphosphate/phosphate phosphohydrolase PLPP6 [Spea bombifrons]
MPSPRVKRTATSFSTNNNGRIEFMSLLTNRTSASETPTVRHRASDSPVHRKDSFSSSTSSQQQQLPEEDCMKLNPSFFGIALRSLLAVDLWLSKKLGVCAREGSSWGSARPMMKLIEISGHGIPWIAGTIYYLYTSDSYAVREVILNLLFALLLDIILVGVVKGIVKRRRPTQNRMDMFATFSVDKYSFPSGHATRAAMVSRFVLNHLVLAVPVRLLVILWAVVVCLSRVMLGRHNVTDVLFGYFMGHMQYSIVEYFWLSPNALPSLFKM